MKASGDEETARIRRDLAASTAEEQRLRDLLDGCDAVVWEMDAATKRFTYVNQGAVRMLGYPLREWLEDADFWPRMIHPDDRAEAVALCARATATGEDHDFEYRALTVDGDVVWLHDHVRTIADATGVTRRLQGVMVDITSQRTAVDQLRNTEEQLRQIVDHVRELFWIFDASFSHTIYMSPAFERMWQRPLADLYADTRSFLESVHPDDRAHLTAAMLRIRDEPVQGIVYRILLPDGSVRWMESRGAPVRDEQGVTYRVVGTTEDITERMMLESERAAAEQHYRRLVQNAPYAVYVLDAQARFTEINPAAAQLIGRPAAEMIGRSIAEIVAPEDLPRAMSSIREKASGAVPVSDLELWMIHASGERRLARIRATAITENGVYVGTHGIAADITDERAREQEMRLLAAALQHVDEGIAIARADGSLLYANAAYAELMGIELERRPLPSFSDFIRNEEEEALLRTAHAQVLREGSWSGRAVYPRQGGVEVPMEFLLSRIDTPDGDPLIFAIVRDASREVERARHLRRAERLASVGTLVAGVAHELNNPLTAITSFATLLLEKERPQEEREDLETIYREALRAAKIVSDLRLLARRTQDEVRELAAVDLNDVATHVMRTRRYAHETGNIDVTMDLAAELPAVRGDRGQLEQVVINLVVNAEQAMERTSGERRLIVRTRASAHGVSLHVIDTGPGIPAGHLERVFDPFFTTKETGEGTGLGLSLVHSIVTEHGGDVRVDSEPGRGTAFHVDLPAMRHEGAASSAEPAAARSGGLRVLVVDDEASIRRALQRYLTLRGHEVVTAADGAEALRILETDSRFDVIVSDLRMPGLSGDRMLEALRNCGGGLDSRVIFLTGDAASGSAARVLADSGAPVIYKPVELSELVRRVEQHARQERRP